MRCPTVLLFLLGTAAITQAAESSDTQVGVDEVTTAAPDRIVLGENERFQPPLPLAGNPMPEYPAASLVLGLPKQTVCVRVSVDVEGKATATYPVSEGPECPAPGNPETAFFEAVAAATRQWTFEPAFRCVFDHKPKPKEPCGGEDTHEEPQAVSVVYRFTFEQANGLGSVRLGD